MSRARPLAVSYRRVAVLLQGLHHDPVELAAHQPRAAAPARSRASAAIDGSVSVESLSRVLGRGGSSSRIRRRISA